MDLNGSLTIMGSSICFVLAMHAIGVQSSFTAPLTAFLVLFVIFVANEYCMGERAMIQGHLLRRQILPNLVYMLFIAGLYFSLLYALPIQFQAIDGTSASESGVRLIPFVLGISIFTLVANTLLTFWRHYKPLLVVGALLATCGAVLIGTLDADASPRMWIAYEVITAMGIGLSLQVPMIANQAAVPDSDIAAVTSMTLFTEMFGTTLFVAAGEAAFTNRLVTSLARHAPSIDPISVVNTGATQIRQTFPPSAVEGILASYLDGCKVSHIVSVACGAAASLVSLAAAVPASRNEWRKWKHKPHVP